jgi:hypothetical protein
MTTTLPINRIGTYLETPRPVLPTTEIERGQLWSDVVFEAVLALRNQLSSHNETISAGAASTILELERTRMRHDKNVAGSRMKPLGLEPILGFDEDEIDEEDEEEIPIQNKVENPPAKRKTSSGSRNTDYARLFDHVQEVTLHFNNSGCKGVDYLEAEQYVLAGLRRCALHVEDIERDQFVATLKSKGQWVER